MSRAAIALVLLLSTVGFTAGCTPSTPSGTADFGGRDFSSSSSSKGDMAMSMTPSGPTDLAMSLPGGCLSLDDYCNVAGNFCVRTWAQAQNAASWCSPGKDVDIFLPTGACPGGVRMVQLGGANFYDNKQLFYSTESDGALVAIVSVGEGGYACDAGDAAYAKSDSNTCTLAERKICASGQITN